MRVRTTALMVLALVLLAESARAQAVTVQHAGKTVTVEKTLPDPDDLWVLPGDLTRINGFVIKPEGACYEDICIPVPQRDSVLKVTRAGAQWYSVTELARRLGQTFSVNQEKRLWTFGPMPKRG